MASGSGGYDRRKYIECFQIYWFPIDLMGSVLLFVKKLPKPWKKEKKKIIIKTEREALRAENKWTKEIDLLKIILK